MNSPGTVIIGSGNVAWAFARALAEAGRPPIQVYARNAEQGSRIAAACGAPFASDPRELAAADLYIMAVSDSAIAQLASCLPFAKGSVVAHTAGGISLDALLPLPERAVIYPLQTFTKGRTVSLREVPVLTEGSTARAAGMAGEVARALSERAMEADSRQRALLHLAAVFACNFTNYMYGAAEEIAACAGTRFDILKPLIAETAAKAAASPSPRAVQTGPASRGDRPTMEGHLKLLADKHELKELYEIISRLIWETSKRT